MLLGGAAGLPIPTRTLTTALGVSRSAFDGNRCCSRRGSYALIPVYPEGCLATFPK